MPQNANQLPRIATSHHKLRIVASICVAIGLAFLFGQTSEAQSIDPVIVEYNGAASGRIKLTNTSLVPMAVVLEPKSFSIGLDGRAVFRALDPTLHVDLSTMSLQLGPQQSYYIFYKAHADKLPAWLTVNAVFTSIRKEDGVKLRIMLPHTVYIYQKKPIVKDEIQVHRATYLKARDVVVCDLSNVSQSLVRVQEVTALGGKSSMQANGFPLLPGSPRHLEIPWKQAIPPTTLVLRFPHFVLKEPLAVEER